MLPARQVTLFTLPRWFSYGLAVILLAASCVVPKKAPKDKPYVYKVNISVEGNAVTSEKRKLKDGLENQLDDSLKVRTVLFFGWPPVYYRLLRPPAYDSLNLSRSRVFMTAYLNANGYFNPNIQDTVTVDTVKIHHWLRFFRKSRNRPPRVEIQRRVKIAFKVIPGKQLKIDSVGYSFSSPALQTLAVDNIRQSLLKKGDPYSNQQVASELDRLLTLFRDNGYYKITKEDIFAERDTVVSALIDPTLDPFEQVHLLDSLKKKRENPTITVVIKQRRVKDSSHIRKFYIGDITVYPDLLVLDEALNIPRDTSKLGNYTFIYNTNHFKLPFVARNITLRPGSLYEQRRYFRTINNFSQLGAWQNVAIDLKERYDSLPLLDASIRLYPAKKQNIDISQELSRDVSDILTTGQLFGIGVNVALLNRNAFRESIQTSTNARFGIELGTQLVQTLQGSLAHNIYFPKFIAPFNIGSRGNPSSTGDRLINPRTFLNLNAAYTDRKDFFKVRSFNVAWGYDWSRRKRREVTETPDQRWTKTWQYIPLNFEYTQVIKTDSLLHLENRIPTYKFAFNDGLIIGQVLSFTAGKEFGNKFTLFRSKLEESGALFGLIRKLELGDLARFVKLDLEYKHYIKYRRSSWAFRGFGGFGFVYGKVDTSGKVVNENTLPFFKAYFAGGPYSMRAWQVRRLGPGTDSLYDPRDTTSLDRFGNMQLEFNVEYRFNLFTIGTVKVNSALFADIGNIWSKEFNEAHQKIPEASFMFNKLYKDIAIGAGTSLRLDFDFLLIRLDWAYRLKDPRYGYLNDGWFHDLRILNGQFQLGIGAPF